jgi:hypothetical protein
MERRVACVAAVLVALSVVAPAAAVATPAAESPAAAGSSTVGSQPAVDSERTPDEAFGLPEQFDPDRVALSAGLRASGDADWQFTYRMRLATDNETQAFEELQADVRENTSAFLDRFRGRIAETVAAAENATEREMAVANVTVSTRVNSLNEESLGVVTYGFAWEGFAATDGERVVAGDALAGFYLDNETSLSVSWPEGYALESVDPDADRPRERAVRWQGALDFGPNQPRVAVAPAPEETTAATTTETTSDTTTEGPGGGDGGGDAGGSEGGTSDLVIPAAVGAVVAVLVLGAGGWLYRTRSGDDDGGAPQSGAGGGGGGSVAGGGAAATTGGSAGGDDSRDEPPAELLSNEERVERFLESQGGRAKQQAVVEQLGWTEAKTSQVVNGMKEDDRLEAFRIGRENVLKLPEADELDE